MKLRKNIQCGLGLAIGILFLAGCTSTPTGSDAAPNVDSEQGSEINVGMFEGTPSPAFAGLSDEIWDPLKVNPINIDSGPAALSLIKGGDLDAIIDAAEAPIAIAAASGISMQVVWASHANEMSIVAGQGISGPEDLKGKVLGTVTGSIAEYFLTRYLADNGVSLDEVEVLNLPPASMVAALKTGQIQAASIWPPTASALAELPGATILDQQLAFSYDVFSSSYLDKHPEAVQQWVCGRAAEGNAYHTDTAKLQDTIAKMIGQQPGDVAAQLPVDLVFVADQQVEKLGTDTIDLTQKIGEWMASDGRVDAAPTIETIKTMFNTEFAEKAASGGCGV